MIPPQAPVAADSVRAVLDEVFAAPRYEWDIPPSPWRWFLDQWWRVAEWLAVLEATHPGAYYALVAGLIVLLVGILVHVGYLTVLAFRRRSETVMAPALRARERKDAAWYRREAERLEAEGRYADSLAHRFAALVFLLDGKRVLRAHPSKTPAEYANEAQLGPAGQGALRDTIDWLYAHLFGGAPLDPAALAEFDRRTDAVLGHGPA